MTSEVMVLRPTVEQSGPMASLSQTVIRSTTPVGTLLRDWRRRRRISQLDLSNEADVSSRHLSYVETGRSQPSRAMVLRLAEALEVPPREQNQLLVAAGFAPAFGERPLDDPEMGSIRDGIERVLTAFEPYPALVVDRSWNLLQANSGVTALMAGLAPHLLEPPINVLRLSLHPDGLAPRIRNLAAWRGHVLARLGREAAVTGSPVVAELLEELLDMPGGLEATHDDVVAMPLVLSSPGGDLRFVSTITTFGTALDLTAAELSIEAFLPADAATAKALTTLSA
jgi:transcriptional regulator with XRE-family HTH domain